MVLKLHKAFICVIKPENCSLCDLGGPFIRSLQNMFLLGVSFPLWDSPWFPGNQIAPKYGWQGCGL